MNIMNPIKNSKNLIKSIVISSNLLLGSILVTNHIGDLPTVQAKTISFSDIPKGSYSEEQIYYLVNLGVIQGYSDGTFQPNKSVTRAQFATFVARALNLQETKQTFKDVPKTSSMYDGVSKAATAGVIKGFADGKFKPNNLVTRADIAVMLDRALQLKGKFTQTKTVTYSDYNQIKGGYADASVKRMSYYGIMGSYSNGQFAPKVSGTREATVLSIYNLLKVVETGKPVTPPSEVKQPVSNKPYYAMTIAELKQAYGEKNLVLRQDNYKEGIVHRDLVADFYNYNKNDKTPTTPEEYFNKEKWAWFFASEYRVFYPNFEVISLNVIPFTDSEFYNPKYFDFETNFLLPKSPKEEGKFYIDLHSKKLTFGTYIKDEVKLADLGELSYVKDNNMMVDIRIFSLIPNVVMNANNIEVNGTKIEFSMGTNKVRVNGVEQTLSTSIEFKNRRMMVPIRSFAKALVFLPSQYDQKLTVLPVQN